MQGLKVVQRSQILLRITKGTAAILFRHRRSTGRVSERQWIRATVATREQLVGPFDLVVSDATENIG